MFELNQNRLFRTFQEMEDSLFSDLGVSGIKTRVEDKGDYYLLLAELPGYSKEEIQVSVSGDALTISAEHLPEVVDSSTSRKAVSRSFGISSADSQRIRASYQNGLLKLELPKKAAEPVRMIPIL